MERSERKTHYGIRGKLISAIAMLMVAVIMCVSSAYAWFTLSTAPEVTGISTAIGANGALEMRLNKTNPGSGEKNAEWGNLVDLAEDSLLGSGYGAKKISLYPAALNLDANGNLALSAPLVTPVYGADGRVANTEANTVISGYYNETNGFVPDETTGFRAIGTVSGMSPRELDHRNAYVSVGSFMNSAQKKAKDSLSNNGSDLAAIAVEFAFSDNPAYKQENVEAIGTMITELEGAYAELEKAYKQAFLALVAGSTLDDSAYAAAKTVIEAAPDLTYIREHLPAGVVIPETLATALSKLDTMKASIEEAKTKQAALLERFTTGAITTCGKPELMEALLKLVNTNEILVNGYKANSENKGNIASSAMSSGIVVSMPTGGGVYADFADQCGNYKVSITVDGSNIADTFKGVTVSAYMETKSTVSTPYATQAQNLVKSLTPPSAAAGALPITEFYGYIVDLEFRTNAANSNLLLQQDAIDRIYSDNTNEETMGHGSVMEFHTDSATLTATDVLYLMNYVRMVFFNPDTGAIYAYGKLDTANADMAADGAKAEIVLYTKTTAANQYTITKTTEESAPAYANEGKYYSDADFATELTADEAATISGADGVYTYTKKTTVTTTAYLNSADSKYYTNASFTSDPVDTAGATITKVESGEVVKTDNVLTSLTQNQEAKVSVLVYLDGETLGNDAVAADNATTMSGTMNLQFASSATLVPMEYADLHTPSAQTTTTPAQSDTPSSSN